MVSLTPHLDSCQKPSGDRSATTYLKPGTVSKEFVRLDRVSQYNAVGEKDHKPSGEPDSAGHSSQAG